MGIIPGFLNQIGLFLLCLSWIQSAFLCYCSCHIFYLHSQVSVFKVLSFVLSFCVFFFFSISIYCYSLCLLTACLDSLQWTRVHKSFNRTYYFHFLSASFIPGGWYLYVFCNQVHERWVSELNTTQTGCLKAILAVGSSQKNLPFDVRAAQGDWLQQWQGTQHLRKTGFYLHWDWENGGSWQNLGAGRVADLSLSSFIFRA